MARLRFIDKNEAAKPGAGSKQEASVQEIDLVESLKRLIQRMAPDLAVSMRSKPDFYVGQTNTLPGLEIALERDSRPKYNIVLDGDTWRIFFPGVRRKSITGDATKGEASVTAVAKWIMDDLGRKPENEIVNPGAVGEGRTPSIKLDSLISKLQMLRKDAGNVDVRINVPVSSTQSEERPIDNVYDEGGYVAIYAGEA